MFTEKENNKNEKYAEFCSCNVIAEMRKKCCPDGMEVSGCFVEMKEMMGMMQDKCNRSKDKPDSN
jgi:hypothetical protein